MARGEARRRQRAARRRDEAAAARGARRPQALEEHRARDAADSRPAVERDALRAQRRRRRRAAAAAAAAATRAQLVDKASEARVGRVELGEPAQHPRDVGGDGAQCAVERAYPPRRCRRAAPESPAEAYSRFAASRPAASVAAPAAGGARGGVGLGRATSCSRSPRCRSRRASVYTRRSTAAELRSSDPTAAAAASIAACSRATPPPLAAARVVERRGERPSRFLERRSACPIARRAGPPPCWRRPAPQPSTRAPPRSAARTSDVRTVAAVLAHFGVAVVGAAAEDAVRQIVGIGLEVASAHAVPRRIAERAELDGLSTANRGPSPP